MLHGAEIQRVSQPRVDDADRRQKQQRPGAGRLRPRAAGEQRIGHHHDARDQKLDDGAVDRRHGAHPLVHQHHRGIERRRQQSQQRAAHRSETAAIRQAGNQRHPQQRGRGADAFPRRELFPQKKRREQDHEDGGHIITQRRRGDRREAVGFKQRDPVCAHRRAGNKQQHKVLPDAVAGELLLSCALQRQQEQRADDPSCRRHRRRGQRDPAAENADGAEDRHGGDQLLQGFCVVVHVCVLSPGPLWSHICFTL